MDMDTSTVKSAERQVEGGPNFTVRKCMVAAPATQHTEQLGRPFTAVGGWKWKGDYSRKFSPGGEGEDMYPH